jgi:hypothetical protein
MEAITECYDLTVSIRTCFEKYRHRLVEIEAETTNLTAAGVFDAIPSESWESRNGGENCYLRLVFPTERGRRRRLYVGVDPRKIEAARAKIERTKRLIELDTERQRITRYTRRAKGKLQQALRSLQGKSRW